MVINTSHQLPGCHCGVILRRWCGWRRIGNEGRDALPLVVAASFTSVYVLTCVTGTGTRFRRTPGTDLMLLLQGHAADTHPFCAPLSKNVYVRVMSGWTPGAAYRITSCFSSHTNWLHPAELWPCACLHANIHQPTAPYLIIHLETQIPPPIFSANLNSTCCNLFCCIMLF